MFARDHAALALTGIPQLHAQAFQTVADQWRTVILCRAVGIYATGLIEEGYASKGFHNKAKSCNWGPMAGFVLDDPRFTKVGGTVAKQEGQREDLLHAIEQGAREVPLFISENRRRWLLRSGLISNMFGDVTRFASTIFIRSVAPNFEIPLRLDFRLKRARPQGAQADMWAVAYRTEDRQSSRPTALPDQDGWTPVLAMRDPRCAIGAKDYRAATTGDYDLFGVWPRRMNYDPGNNDRRMVGNKDLEINIQINKWTPPDQGGRKPATGEDEDLGNMTPRIRTVRLALNNTIKLCGYSGGDMVHHSDEVGRPFVRDVDLPVFAVVPGQLSCFGIDTLPDLKAFIAQFRNDYMPTFNAGWSQLWRDELLSKTLHRR